MSTESSRHIVILGAGFGGLNVAKKLRHPSAHITLVDRQNHHLFQPLLYQVATAALSAPEIAQPVRSIFSRRRQVTVLMDTVTHIDFDQRKVILDHRTLDYDYLIIALGGVTSYFGHPEWEEHAPGLKSLEDGLRIRHRVLQAFERAETEEDPAVRDRLMTLVVVGGGPTGVELAGAFSELTRRVLRSDFRRIDSRNARVILLEAGPDLLGHLPENLRISARRQLEGLGVQVRTGARVNDIEPRRLTLQDGEVIEAENIIWAAGVQGHPLMKELDLPLDRAGRVEVEPDLSVPGHREVFVIGDLARVTDENGEQVPGVAPAAMQMAAHVAEQLEVELDQPHPVMDQRSPFRYWDKGTMATIGRSKAVAWAGPLQLHGLVAWLAWLFIHLLFLVGLRNKLAVLLQWAYAYFAYKRGARIITSPRNQEPDDS